MLSKATTIAFYQEVQRFMAMLELPVLLQQHTTQALIQKFSRCREKIGQFTETVNKRFAHGGEILKLFYAWSCYRDKMAKIAGECQRQITSIESRIHLPNQKRNAIHECIEAFLHQWHQLRAKVAAEIETIENGNIYRDQDFQENNVNSQVFFRYLEWLQKAFQTLTNDSFFSPLYHKLIQRISNLLLVTLIFSLQRLIRIEGYCVEILPRTIMWWSEHMNRLQFNQRDEICVNLIKMFRHAIPFYRSRIQNALQILFTSRDYIDRRYPLVIVEEEAQNEDDVGTLVFCGSFDPRQIGFAAANTICLLGAAELPVRQVQSDPSDQKDFMSCLS